MTSNAKNIPCAMTIAGSDSGAGAGIQADMLAIVANGVYACTAIAAITAQNPDGVRMISAPDTKMLAAQMDAVVDFYKPTAAKTGMLFNAEIVECVADFFERHAEIKLVVDPVMIATSGAKLLEDDAVEVMKSRLLPRAFLITPNLDEAAFLLSLDKIDDIKKSAAMLAKKFGCNALLKGGHIKSENLIDALATTDGRIVEIRSQRLNKINTHGSGCTLSAAIAANLAKGESLEDACKNAHAYLLAGMKNSITVGNQNFINHFPQR